MLIKNLINEEIVKFDEEIRQKQPIGMGKEHHIYDFEKDPTKVIKVAWDSKEHGDFFNPENRKQVNLDPQHIEVFKKYPDLFPVVYKVTNRYAIIEKLETEKVKQEEKQLFNQIKPLGFGDLRFISEYSAINDIYWQITNRKGLLDKILKKMEATGEDMTLFQKYVNLFKRINSTVKRIRPNVDVGSYNLGYDGNGNLKLLDF